MNANTHRTLLLVAVLVLLPGASRAAEPAPAGMSPATRSALVAAAPKGPEFQSNDVAYRVVGGLRATPHGGDAGAVKTVERLGGAPSDLVEVKGPFAIYRDPAGPARAMNAPARVGGVDTLPVVENLEAGTLAVATNVVIVKLANVSQAGALSSATGLPIEFLAEHIGYAFFRVPDGRDIIAAAAALARDPRVLSANIEVREHFPQLH